MPVKYKIREICKLRHDCALSCHNCYFVKRCEKNDFKMKQDINNYRKETKGSRKRSN